MSNNFFKFENNNTITCLQKNCTYKFRDSNKKHTAIIEHYRRMHKTIYNEIKANIKPYSKTIQQNHFSSRFITQQPTSQQENQTQNTIQTRECNNIVVYNELFCFHYFVDRRYYIFKFYKLKNGGYYLKIFCSGDIIKIIDEKLDDFSFSFTMINNNNFIKLIEDEYFFLDDDVKIVKIYFKNNIIFESDIISLFIR
ncbi:15845_t:CDS:1 [Dentiscutata erythropus]|uniref:15845_t:CDS:1 n=1 Tax=Dentiscutata erythropus TaxID=1348616 RepID=A0A9N9ERM5_9GLOM|nr:15845_t:CDS:1 [Dentiscutata erythropus]